MVTNSQPTRDQLRAAISVQAQSVITVLSCLLAIQDAFEYLPDESIEEVATHMDASINEVWGVASFYTNFRFTPPGEHIVEVCWGPTCHLLGAATLLKAVMDDLDLTDEGETANRNVTLKYNTCLGACAQAPVMMIDHDLIGRLTVEQARRRILEL